MQDIRVVPGEKGKFKVLINFIQQGPEYSSKEMANQQMSKLTPAKLQQNHVNKDAKL